MNVRDLIERLFTCDLDAEVQIAQYCDDSEPLGIDGVDREGDTYVIY